LTGQRHGRDILIYRVEKVIMKVSVEEISSVKRRVHVELPEEDVSRELRKAYRKLNRSVKMKGFRPGKVPLNILKRYYADQVHSEVGLELINNSLKEALEESAIELASQPQLDRKELKEGEPFRYSVLVEVKPDIAMADYHGLEIRSERLQVTEEEIEAELERRRQNSGYLRSPEPPRPVQQGDYVTLDFKAYSDGHLIRGGEVKGFQLEVGAGKFNAEFEERLVGSRAGDFREITASFPADYGNKEIAGRSVTFEVEIKDVRERVLPELDDDFARDLGEFQNLEELRTAVAKQLEEEHRERIAEDNRRQLLDKLLAANPFEVPEGMVEQELQQMLDTFRFRLAQQNVTMEQAGITDEEFKKRNRDVAERKVRTTIILEKIAVQEGIELTDEEVEQSLQQKAAASKQSFEKVKDFYETNRLMEALRYQLLQDKVVA